MKFERLAALGALGVAGAVTVTYFALAWLASTTPVAGVPGSTGGIDAITRDVVRIAALVPTLIFIVTHRAFARQLRAGRSSPRG